MLRKLERRPVTRIRKSSEKPEGVDEVRSPSLEVTFGPSGNEWRYTPLTKTYDLTRGLSQRGFTFSTTRGPEGISVRIAPEVTALVIIDMQNYFLHPSCNDHPSGLAAVECTLDVIKKCRELGIKVSFICFCRVYSQKVAPKREFSHSHSLSYLLYCQPRMSYASFQFYWLTTASYRLSG
jgi:hypothetical protein